MISKDNESLIENLKPEDRIYIHYEKINNYIRAIPVNLKLLEKHNTTSKNLSTFKVEFNNTSFVVDGAYLVEDINEGDYCYGLLCFIQNTHGEIVPRLPIGVNKGTKLGFYTSFPENEDEFSMRTDILVEKDIKNNIKFNIGRIFVLN